MLSALLIIGCIVVGAVIGGVVVLNSIGDLLRDVLGGIMGSTRKDRGDR